MIIWLNENILYNMMKLKEKQHIIATVLYLLIFFTTTVGVSAQETQQQYGASVTNGKEYYGQQDEIPFAMHSVMKFPQALYVAEYLNSKGLSLSDSVLVEKKRLDHDTWSPMLRTFEGKRYFTFAELLTLSLAQSDNNACDLLFASCGAPTMVENYLRVLGFKQIHVRLTEKEMKENPQKATENSATSKDMVRLMEWFMIHRGDNTFLTFIWNTMADCRTGAERIAAVRPEGSTLIHKTGSGRPLPDGRQDRNDVGIILLPDGSHISIAIFLPNSEGEKEVATIARQLNTRLKKR